MFYKDNKFAENLSNAEIDILIAEYTDTIISCAKQARQGGILALESYLSTAPVNLLSVGLSMVVHYVPSDLISATLGAICNNIARDNPRMVPLCDIIVQGCLMINAGDPPDRIETMIKSLAFTYGDE